MPPKEGPSRTGPNPDWRFSAMRFSAHVFLFVTATTQPNLETKKPGKISDSCRFVDSWFPDSRLPFIRVSSV
jgi:hypothetical protein